MGPRAIVPQKRPLSRTQTPSSHSTSNTNSEVIEISSEDEPSHRSWKKKKSTPPITDGGINGVHHKPAHTGTSAGASDQHKSGFPFLPQPKQSRESQSPWLQNRENLKPVTTTKTALKKVDMVSRKNRTPIPHNINSNNASAPQDQSETTGLATTGPRNHLYRWRLPTSSTMEQKMSRKSQNPQKDYPSSFDIDPEVIESGENGKQDTDGNASESEIDRDILSQFLPTKRPKSNHIPEELSSVSDNNPQEPNLKIKVQPQPQQHIAASFPFRSSPSSTKAQRPSTPPRQKNLQIVVPQSNSKEDFMARRADLMEELKKDTRIAKEKRDVIERYFGQNGFSEAFSVDDLARMIEAAPLFKRAPKDRSKVKLDWSTYTPPSPKYDKNGKFIRYDPVHPADRVRKLLNARFDRYKTHPTLTFRNDIDDRHINGRFQFIDEYTIKENIKRVAPHTNSGCACEGVCNPTTCECLVKKIPGIVNNQKIIDSRIVKTYKQHPVDPSLIVLDDDYMTNELNPANQHFEIIECNELCGCGPSCFNRVVGRGRTIPLEIYMTERCGFGVRSSYNIHKGQFIDRYLGEVITTQEVVARESIKHPSASSYIYSLDWFNSTNCLHVDGEEVGSAMRFVNHSCSPNARNFTVQTHHGDNRIYKLAFFAIRDIPAGEQITIDYCPQEAIDEPTSLNPPQIVPQKVLEGYGADEDPDMYGAAPDPGAWNNNDNNDNAKQHITSATARFNKERPEEGDDNDDDDEYNQPAPFLPTEERSEEEEIEEGRTRCYCGAPNCRKYLWRKAGRRRRKHKTMRFEC